MRFLRSKVPRLRGITSFIDWTWWTQNRVSRNRIRSFVRTCSRIVGTIIVDGLKSLVWIRFSSSFNSNVRFLFMCYLIGMFTHERMCRTASFVLSSILHGDSISMATTSPWQQYYHDNNIRHSSSHRSCSCLWSVLCSLPHFQCVCPPAFSLRSCL
jgi:hypothetical protein